jgi:hypothetical protein
MDTTAPSATARTRARIADHQLKHPGIPTPLPFPDAKQTRVYPERQRANLLQVAIWITEYDRNRFVMANYHDQPDPGYEHLQLPAEFYSEDDYNHCGTTHCIAGFAQVMAGPAAFLKHPSIVAWDLLGKAAFEHFCVSEAIALEFLQGVITAGEEGPEA